MAGIETAGYFWLALIVVAGMVLARLAAKSDTWISQGVFWQIVVIMLATAAWAISSQRALLGGKTILIMAIAAFASVALWMMVWHNEVGINGYSVAKTTMAVALAFVLLMLSLNGAVDAMLKADAQTLETGGGKVTLVVKDPSKVKSIRYAWSDSPMITRVQAETVELGGDDKNTADFNQPKRHLTVWLDATNGVITRIDRWYPANGGLF